MKSKSKLRIKIDNAELWLDKQLNLPLFYIILLEFLFAFLLVFIVGLPLALADMTNTNINTFWDFINKVNIARIFYSVTTIFSLFVIARKFRVSARGLGATYRMAARTERLRISLLRMFMQFIGTFVATFILTQISISTGNFIKNYEIVKPPEMMSGNNGVEYFMGTSLGGPRPIMRGLFIMNDPKTVVSFDGNHSFYFARFSLEILMITLLGWSILWSKRYEFRKHILLRYLTWFLVFLVSMKFQAHSANTWRYISGTIIMHIYGGYANWELLAYVVSAHIIGYSMMFLFVRSERFPNLR